MVCSLSSPAADARLSFRWLALGEGSADLIAMRCAIYGDELAWVGQGDATFAWDAYDRVSTALVVRDGARLVASGRLDGRAGRAARGKRSRRLEERVAARSSVERPPRNGHA